MNLLSLSVTILLFITITPSDAKFLAQPVTMVPAIPVQTQAQTCRLDLSDELFGGVNLACGKDLDRSRCCPVLAAWLFAAHARWALKVDTLSPAPDSPEDLPMLPDDSQKCVNSLQSALINRSIYIPQPNSSCDPVMCFCGIRLHKITSLSCPAAFSLNSTNHTAVPTAAVKNLEKNCQNSSYSGCTKCLGALQKLKAQHTNDTSERASKMFSRDCQLMGLTWLLARNKTAYIPTVSAVLRAIMYSAHPLRDDSTCSPDQENMPLAVDSLELEKAQTSSAVAVAVAAASTPPLVAMLISLLFIFPVLPLITLEPPLLLVL